MIAAGPVLTSRGVLSLLVASVLGYASPARTAAQQVSLADLQGTTIQTTSTYTGRFRSARGEANGGFTLYFTISVGPGTAIEWTMTRDVWADTPRGRKTGQTKRSGKSTIGEAGEFTDGSGNAVWLLEGNKLRVLRAFERGGFMLEINLTKTDPGLQCSATAPMMQEVGAGPAKTTSGFEGGGHVEILRAKPISSTCRIR